MKFFVSIVLIALLSMAACLYLPWWSIAIAAFAVAAIIPQKPWWSFLSGFIALLLLWGGLSFFISSNNDHLMAKKISILLLQSDSPFTLVAATALIGALVAGLAALSGSFVRRAAD
ncbi:MAG TPA: hypothetical protein PLY34_06460 [Ferruginibacter sp.]|nr:hypothetical protein [Ferruginibacter sp.]HPH89567.1 hypothetical protein [Ferruginibacter sp.]